MVLVKTTYQVAAPCESNWTEWLKTTYIPAVTHSGLLVNPKLFRLLVEEEPETKHYALQFAVADLETLEAWFEATGKTLQHSMGQVFKEEVLGFTTLMEQQPL